MPVLVITPTNECIYEDQGLIPLNTDANISQIQEICASNRKENFLLFKNTYDNRLNYDKMLRLPIKNLLLENSEKIDVTVNGPTYQLIGLVPYEYIITNYDFEIDYIITAITGTVTRVKDIITYTPINVIDNNTGFIINGKTIPAVVIASLVTMPSIISPANNSVLNSDTATFISDAFQYTGNPSTHYSSDWQISTDASFTTILLESINDTINKYTFTVNNLLLDTSYFIRVRYKSNLGVFSSWSNILNITTNVLFAPANEIAKKIANDKESNDNFGMSIAISGDGTRIIVGADKEDTNGTNAGSVYIFLDVNGTWIQEAKIQSSDIQAYDYFGTSVDIDTAGSRIIVGAYGEDSNGSNAGAAYIFLRSGTTWTQEAKLLGNDTESLDYFGASVAMSGDGIRVIVGAYNEDTGSGIPGTPDEIITNAGAAYIFLRSGTSWTQEAKLQASDRVQYNIFDQLVDTSNLSFGRSVDINDNGSKVIIGAIGDNVFDLNISLASSEAMQSVTYYNAGAAYIFIRSGVTWTEQSKLTADIREDTAYYGLSVSISGNGSRCIVGAPREQGIYGIQAGAAYIYYNSINTWNQEYHITPSDLTVQDQCGTSVSINYDGSMSVIGSFRKTTDGIDGTGEAYIYNRVGSTWTELNKLFASDKASLDYFGSYVDIDMNSNTIIISAPNKNVSPYTNAGVMYIFK